MGKITLNEALKKAPVKNDLQMFLGLDAQSELGGMTPERLAAVAGESGRFPRMGQGALIGNDIKNIPDGCCYSYGGSSGDGSPISGPTLSLSATPECKLQIKASVTGNRLMFRVRHIETRVWSDWTEISIKQ